MSGKTNSAPKAGPGSKPASAQGTRPGFRPRKIPMRQCLGCNEHKPKIELLRVVRTPEGEILLDFTGKRSGRGAYICRDVSCLRRVRKSHRLERSLDCTIPEEVYDRMEAELARAEATHE